MHSSVGKFDALLKRSGLFRGLSEPAFEKVMQEVHPAVQTYRKNDIIVEEGQKEVALGIVAGGRIRGVKFHRDGDSHLMMVYEEGDVFSLSSASSRTRIAPLSMIAMGDVTVISIHISDLMNCTANWRIARNIIAMLADESIKSMYKIDILSHTGLRRRIMTYLRIMDAKHEGKAFHTGMNQEQFAQYLSVNRSALSNQLNIMRREGIIDFRGDLYQLLKKE